MSAPVRLEAEHDRRLRLDALATLGAAIQRERTEDAVFARVRDELERLGVSSAVMRAEADGVRIVSVRVPREMEAAFGERMKTPLAGFLGAWSDFSREVWSAGFAYTDDWGEAAAGFVADPAAPFIRTLVNEGGLPRAIAVRLDQRDEVRLYLVAAGDWLRRDDVPAVRLFAAQVAAALDAARTIADLSRRNAELAALNRVAQLAGEATSIDELFARGSAILRDAISVEGLAVFVVDEAAGELVRAYEDGVPPSATDAYRRVPLAGFVGEVARTKVPHLLEVGANADARDARQAELAELGFTSFAWVPLVVRSRGVGVMAAGFRCGLDVVRGRMELLAAVGAHFASAIESHGLLADLRRRVSELTLLNDLAVAVAQLDPVLLLDAALRRVCETFDVDVGAAFLREGERLVLVADRGLPPECARVMAETSAAAGAAGEALQRLAPVVTDAAAAFSCGPEASGACPHVAAAVAVPILAKNQALGALVLGRGGAPCFADRELTLLTAVGVQLGVAVENARLFADVRRRLSDLEAVHSLALRIFGNAPGDVKSLLEDACRESARALSCRAAALFLTEDDGRLRGVAGFGTPVSPESLTIAAGEDGLAADAIRRGAPAWSDDVMHDPRSAMHARQGAPPLAMLAVPLISRDAVQGVLYLADDAGRVFTDPELALATALAGELAVGVENAELYAEAQDRLAELSTVIEVARVVSSSLELEKVLGAGAEHLKRTLAGSACTILLDDFRGELRRAASTGEPIGPPSQPLSAPSLATQALESRLPISGHAVATGGAALLAVPLHVRDQPVGVALVADVDAARVFTPAELSRAMAIASQLAIAAENARLYSEARRRAQELGLLHEVGRSLVATLDIEQVLDAGVRNLARIVDAPDAYLALVTPDGAHLELRASAGAKRYALGTRSPVKPPDGNLLTLVFDRREPLVIEDAFVDPRVRAEMRARSGGRAYLGLPLIVRDRTIGAALIVDTRAPRRFTPAEVDRAAAIANQLAVAVENARLYEDLRASYAELARAQRQLIEQERLAALGELSAIVAHEVRNPLGVIFNSLGSLRRLLRPSGDAKMLFDIVGEEADRLNRIVGDLLDFARPSTPQLRPEALGDLVEDAVKAALAQNPDGIRLERAHDPDLPAVPVDARLVRQAVVNVAVNAVQAMPRGGTLTVRTRRDGAAAIVELEDTGPGIAEEVRARIFEPFFTTKASGTGLGLAVVKRIVDGHGGVVTVRSGDRAGTVFSLGFPLETGAVGGSGRDG